MNSSMSCQLLDTTNITDSWPNWPTGGPIERVLDSEKLFAVKRQLNIVVHAVQCGQYNCPLPHCALMKIVVNHMKTCTAGSDCPVEYCFSSKQIEQHWLFCRHLYSNCQLCRPTVQPLTQRKPKPMDPYMGLLYGVQKIPVHTSGPDLTRQRRPAVTQSLKPMGPESYDWHTPHLRDSTVNRFFIALKVSPDQTIKDPMVCARNEEEKVFYRSVSSRDYDYRVSRRLRDIMEGMGERVSMDNYYRPLGRRNEFVQKLRTFRESLTAVKKGTGSQPESVPIAHCTRSRTRTYPKSPFMGSSYGVESEPNSSANKANIHSLFDMYETAPIGNLRDLINKMVGPWALPMRPGLDAIGGQRESAPIAQARDLLPSSSYPKWPSMTSGYGVESEPNSSANRANIDYLSPVIRLNSEVQNKYSHVMAPKLKGTEGKISSLTASSDKCLITASEESGEETEGVVKGFDCLVLDSAIESDNQMEDN